MNKCIIRCVGKFDELITALKTMQAVYGKDAKLCEIETAKRFYEVKKIVGNQFEKGE